MRRIETEQELTVLPVASVVETASGIRYVKRIDGFWGGVASLRAPSRWLVDPDHSRQPLTVLYVPGGS